MQLIGQTINHKLFGQGVVTNLGGNILTVCFSEGEKKFIYPDVFSQHLILKDNTMQSEIQGILKKKEAAKEAHHQALQKEQEKKYLIRNLKISPNAQAVFNIKDDQKKDVFSTWSVSTGCYLSGYSKGEPRVPNRLKPNSMCLLTACSEGAPEDTRRVLGAFMVGEDFLGAYCLNGVVKAHPFFRLKLSPKKQPLFWPYIGDEPSVKRWGGVPFKHFANDVIGNVLFDMKESVLNTEDAERAEQFYDYYCKINRLQPKLVD